VGGGGGGGGGVGGVDRGEVSVSNLVIRQISYNGIKNVIVMSTG
jgi:hypothetical protein